MAITEVKQIGATVLVYNGQIEIARYEGRLLSFTHDAVRISRGDMIYIFNEQGDLAEPPKPS